MMEVCSGWLAGCECVSGNCRPPSRQTTTTMVMMMMMMRSAFSQGNLFESHTAAYILTTQHRAAAIATTTTQKVGRGKAGNENNATYCNLTRPLSKGGNLHTNDAIAQVVNKITQQKKFPAQPELAISLGFFQFKSIKRGEMAWQLTTKTCSKVKKNSERNQLSLRLPSACC